jgi:hypothetical protein
MNEMQKKQLDRPPKRAAQGLQKQADTGKMDTALLPLPPPDAGGAGGRSAEAAAGVAGTTGEAG